MVSFVVVYIVCARHLDGGICVGALCRRVLAVVPCDWPHHLQSPSLLSILGGFVSMFVSPFNGYNSYKYRCNYNFHFPNYFNHRHDCCHLHIQTLYLCSIIKRTASRNYVEKVFLFIIIDKISR